MTNTRTNEERKQELLEQAVKISTTAEDLTLIKKKLEILEEQEK